MITETIPKDENEPKPMQENRMKLFNENNDINKDNLIIACQIDTSSNNVCNLGTASCILEHTNEEQDIYKIGLEKQNSQENLTNITFEEKEIKPMQEEEIQQPVDNRERVIEINGKRFTSMEAFHKYMLKQNKHKKPARASNLFSKMFSKVQSSEVSSNKVGRGLTTPIFHIDESPFLPNEQKT